MSNKFRSVVREIIEQIVGGVLVVGGFLVLFLSFAVAVTRCAEADTLKSVIADEVPGSDWILGTIDDEPLILYRSTSPSGDTTTIGVAGDSAVIIDGNSYRPYLEHLPNEQLIYPNVHSGLPSGSGAVLRPEDNR